MKKIIISLIALLGLTCFNINVYAVSSNKLYGIKVQVNSKVESQTVGEEQISLAGGSLIVNKDNISFNNLNSAEYFFIENNDTSTTNINITLNNNSVIEVFDCTQYSGEFTFSGTGSLKLKPASMSGTKPTAFTDFIDQTIYYEDNLASWVSRRVKTSLPVTYVDDYVCINCKSETSTNVNSSDNNQNNANENTNNDQFNSTNTTNQTTNNSDNEVKTVKTLTYEDIKLTSLMALDSTYQLDVKITTNNYTTNEINSILKENETLIDIYDINVIDKDKKIVKMENGTYTISIKLKENVYKSYMVYYINNKEIQESINPTINDNYLEFNTSHLSEYMIVQVEDEKKVETQDNVIENINEEKVEKNNNTIYIIVAALAVIALIGLIFLIKRKSSK